MHKGFYELFVGGRFLSYELVRSRIALREEKPDEERRGAEQKKGYRGE